VIQPQELQAELQAEHAGSGTGDGFAVAEPTPAKRAMRAFFHNPTGVVAFSFICLVIVVAIFAPVLAPHGEAEQLGKPFTSPGGQYPLGTDDLGRDLLSRLIYGTRVSVRASIQTVAMALVISVPLALASGYIGGKFDLVIMRVMDAVASFPTLILALSIAAVLGPGLTNAMIAITVALVPSFVRLIRGQALAVTQETYVEASRAIGTHTRTILRKRILPGVASVLIVQVSLILGVALVAEAALSFLGLGIQPPHASWGGMLQEAFQTIYSHPYQMFVPGLAIGLTVLAYNTIGDALRDALGLAGAHTVKGMKRGKLGITSVKEMAPAPPAPPEPLLSVQGLAVEFATSRGLVTAVDDVSFDVRSGEVVGLVGESGCGKSVSSLSIMRLIPTPPGRIRGGRVYFEGRDLLSMPFEELRQVRGDRMSMVFQDPMSSLNPAFTIGNQLVEAIRLHRGTSRAQATNRAAELLDLVGIPDARSRLDEYPHRLSGGMRQRVLIAMALSNDPKLLIADEPTTALDVTIQAQILELLKSLRQQFHMAVIFVTHDLGVVADICDRVAVMYAGQVVEQASVHELFSRPAHPYTRALLKAMPQTAEAHSHLNSIPGRVPIPGNWPGMEFRWL
jgi:peptide/nickel transport system permease protein